MLDVDRSPGEDFFVVTASAEGTAIVWDGVGRRLAVLRGHAGAVKQARFAPDGKRILTLGLDGDARLYRHQGHRWRADEARGEVLADGDAATVEAYFLGPERILTRDAQGYVRRYTADGTPVGDPEGAAVTVGGAQGGARHPQPRAGKLAAGDGVAELEVEAAELAHDAGGGDAGAEHVADVADAAQRIGDLMDLDPVLPLPVGREPPATQQPVRRVAQH